MQDPDFPAGGLYCERTWSGHAAGRCLVSAPAETRATAVCRRGRHSAWLSVTQSHHGLSGRPLTFPGLAAPRRTKTGPRRNDADMRLSGTRPNALGGWIPSGCPATRWTCTGVSAGIGESYPAGPVPLQGPGAHHCHPSPRAPNATSHGRFAGRRVLADSPSVGL